VTGLRFRETMTGRLTPRTSDPIAGYGSSGAFGATMRAEVVITDVADFTSAPGRGARLRAELVIPALGGRFLSHDGRFALYNLGTDARGRRIRQITYRAMFVNDDRTFKLYGRKILQPGWHLWGDTTTLHVTLTDVTLGACLEGLCEAAGFIKITPVGFLAQLTTMRGFGEDTSWLQRRRAVLTYVKCFTAGLVRTYLLRKRW
jgi:hypothetical protein